MSRSNIAAGRSIHGEGRMTRGRWRLKDGRAGHRLADGEKHAINQACEAFIGDVLKPRFLTEIRPSETFNYPVDICGKWHGGKYRCIQGFRSDREDALESEFDSPFARLEYVSPNCFDLAHFRHTGQWWTVYRGISLAEALSLLETEGIFHPIS